MSIQSSRYVVRKPAGNAEMAPAQSYVRVEYLFYVIITGKQRW
jgi:hypothetical protein